MNTTIANAEARLLLLGAQGLLDDPARPSGPAALADLIAGLGFVQVDTINAVARAQDLILWTRLLGYTPAQLQGLLEGERVLFEGWTHDASIIPLRWYCQWKPRFRRDAARLLQSAWWRQLLGEEPERVMAHVRERIAAEGPLRSADFEHPGKRGPWWGWKPQKAALDYLWRSGELAVRGRVNFQKVYDLAGRVHPEEAAAPAPGPAAHLSWTCETAAERLIVFTARELAAFWAGVDLAEARGWCQEALKQGRIIPVQVEGAQDQGPQESFALAEWRDRLGALPAPPAGLRLLSPFDPVIRDRARCLRRFGFDYRFEAFVPEAQRVYGYYVLPILEGDRLVGRLDPRLRRDQGVLEVRGVWWEKGIRATRARKAALQEAVERLAAFALRC